MTNDKKQRALVIGGSMAGLLAARALADYFAEVTILERDAVHDQPESRKGQPQTQHSHLLLFGGLLQLNSFFPGLEADLIAGGAICGTPETGLWHHHGDYLVPFQSEMRVVISSRPFLEWQVRQRVLDLPNVTLLSACGVTALTTTPDKSRVTGVTYPTPSGQAASSKKRKRPISLSTPVDAAHAPPNGSQSLATKPHAKKK